MDVLALILSVVAITVIVYDFLQRKKEIGLYNEQRESLDLTMKALGEAHNKFVTAQTALSEQIELINLKLSGLQSAAPNRRL